MKPLKQFLIILIFLSLMTVSVGLLILPLLLGILISPYFFFLYGIHLIIILILAITVKNAPIHEDWNI